jgi:hypothetical protein
VREEGARIKMRTFKLSTVAGKFAATPMMTLSGTDAPDSLIGLYLNISTSIIYSNQHLGMLVQYIRYIKEVQDTKSTSYCISITAAPPSRKRRYTYLSPSSRYI